MALFTVSKIKLISTTTVQLPGYRVFEFGMNVGNTFALKRKYRQKRRNSYVFIILRPNFTVHNPKNLFSITLNAVQKDGFTPQSTPHG